MDFGKPLLAACLVDGAARLPASTCWIALPPEALTSARIGAGQVVFVGVSGRVVPQTAPGALGGGHSGTPPRSPATSLASSSFGPTPELLAPDPRTGEVPQPQDLWHLCGARLQLPGSASASGAPGSGAPGGPGGFLGGHLLPARVWPASKLPRATALLSPALRESAGQPPPGTVLLLYRQADVAAAAAAGAEAAAALDSEPSAAGAAVPGGTSNSVAASVAPASGGGDGNGGGGLVVLQLCAETLLQTRFTAPPPSVGGGSGNGSSASSSSVGTPGGPAAAAGTPGASKGLAGDPPSTPIATPARARRGAASPSAGRSPAPSVAGGAAAGAAAGGPSALQQWPLDTLRRAVEAGDEATRASLAAVARQHLAGRHLLVGAPVVLPVLGSAVLCRVAAAVAATAATTGTPTLQGSMPSLPSSKGRLVAEGMAAIEVTRGTQVVMLYPGEPLPEQVTQGPGGRASGGDGGGGGNGSAALASRLIASAREAAAAAVAESAAEAASDAAERALRAGLASGGIDFSQLGGVDAHLLALRELVGLPLRAPQLFAQYGIRAPRGVLLYGPPGSGKTVLARAAAADAGATVLLINGPDVVSEYYGESESSLRGIFAAAAALAPAVVLIDEVDALAPARAGGGGASAHSSGAAGAGSDVASRLVTAMLTLLDGAEAADRGVATGGTPRPGSGPGTGTGAATGLGGGGGAPAAPPKPVVVIAATNRPDALDPALRRPGRLEREIEVGLPSAHARLEILQARLRSVRHSLRPADVAALASAAHGFVSADLAALVDEAAMCALRRRVAARTTGAEGAAAARGSRPDAPDGPTHLQVEEGGSTQEPGDAAVKLEDFKTAETRVRPSALREVAVEVPAVRWGDIGGLHSVKQALREAVEWPHKAQKAMSRLGAQPPRGVLLYGPPGCSKTLLARAVASEAGLNFLAVKAGELVSKYVGESEKAVAALFARARATAPAIIFFDEIDGLVGSRGGPGGGGGGGGGSGVSERVLSQLLTEMDGLMDRGGVTVLAATNRPDCVDPALLRPGRFDRLILVPLPDLEARAEILRVHLRKCPVAADVDVSLLAERSEGYSGADLSAVVREAGLAALEEDMAAQQIAQRHLSAALLAVQPSAPSGKHLAAMYREIQRTL